MEAKRELLVRSSGLHQVATRSQQAAADAVASEKVAKKREEEALVLRKMALEQLKVGSLHLVVSSCAAWD